jgi:hypothetical protein
MPLKKLLGKWFDKWPRNLPRLYPGLDDLQLAQFLSDDQYARIKAFRTVYVLPFASEKQDEVQTAFGYGLSRLMIRNLMLLRDISIRGPEDTPQVTFEYAPQLMKDDTRSCYVRGIAHFDESGFQLRVHVHAPAQPEKSVTVRSPGFRPFLRDCSMTLSRLLASTEPPDSKAWDVGQPRDKESLVRCGEISADYDREDTVERHEAAQIALRADPEFVVPAWDLDSEQPGTTEMMLESLKHDPCNAQLYFLAFIAVWNAQGAQPEALQFCRRALELSPGHGKAHMCAGHTALPEADMLKHYDLGYVLLPGNSFAVNNLIIYLDKHGAAPERLIGLAAEGVENDSEDPGNYERLIEIAMELTRYDTALETAERLQELYEPIMNQRALYCLRQNPEVARLLDAGAYDPAALNRDRIAKLRAMVSKD